MTETPPPVETHALPEPDRYAMHLAALQCADLARILYTLSEMIAAEFDDHDLLVAHDGAVNALQSKLKALTRGLDSVSFSGRAQQAAQQAAQ